MKDATLFNKERQQKIIELLHREGSVSVNQLAVLFHVTTATIRADLSRLEAERELTRTHGGAITYVSSYRELKMNERHNEEQKQRIAAKAATLVGEQDILLIDTGTTMCSLARALVASPIKELTIFTNDIDVIRILEDKEGFSLHLFAGQMRNGFHYCYGAQMTQALRNCHFSKLFLSASAISTERGLTLTNPELAQIKREMIAASDQVILLADSSKMHQVNFQKFADLEQMDVLIMDDALSDEDVQSLKHKIKNVILV